MVVSHRLLKFLALLTWTAGGVVLLLKGYALFAEAEGQRPGAALNYVPFPAAVAAGGFKARYLFIRSCRKNLSRIESIAEPRIWQFFRPVFFLFLFCMISLGAWLSTWASGSYPRLLTVATVDMTLSVALLGSLVGFRRGNNQQV